MLVAHRARAADAPVRRLSPRELEIPRELAQGKSNGAIAQALREIGTAELLLVVREPFREEFTFMCYAAYKRCNLVYTSSAEAFCSRKLGTQ